ncbi:MULTISPECIES: VOC family protein [Flavobacterium]|uniref:Glyoxalase/bleomycin resistance/extradiol dioxygenase family protein n=1 Tax=Flavobacterium salmonis TaxID=2654844 RepID=A0A6V6YT40_9FLAO|nr:MULTISPECIES: VOC family protein [Flavobacterium]OOV20053.1 glyoxalase/bleomycin resistance/extradiol dioxygenase family protein [Flavobacterium sp. LM4]CAD0002651.1 glyoxalase/bleomycin resistance/extradiol dioxygenase family protein [Flavobacterium salmonis]
METKIFLNLPVKDLNKSISFFTQLGFSFDPKFTNQKGTCLIIGENIFAMLLLEEFFKTFTQKEICNTMASTEMIAAISVESREKVDEIITAVVKAGGKLHNEAKDYGWMYQRDFFDLDGHHWEIFFMDESQIPQEG